MTSIRAVVSDTRAWTDVAPYAPRPDTDALRESWGRLRFVQVDDHGDGAVELVEAFRASPRGHGDALLASFEVEGADAAAHWFLSRNRFDEYGFAWRLVGSQSLAESVPDLVPDWPEDRINPFDPAGSFFEVGARTLTKAIGWRLGLGRRYAWPADADALAGAFTTEVMGGRFADFRVDRCAVGWSGWFHHACWDDSWMITDRRRRRVTLLCCTDQE